MMDWLQTNWGHLVDFLLLLAAALVGLAKLTPTPKDDALFAKILGWLNLLPHTAKANLAQANAERASKKAAWQAQKAAQEKQKK